MQEVRNLKKSLITQTYESASECLTWGTEEENPLQQFIRSGSVTEESGKNPWLGTNTLDECKKLVACGWEPGTAAILDMVKQIEAKDDTVQRGYDWDVTGDLFDVGEVVQGTPECWLTPAFEEAPRVVSVCVNLAMSASVGPQQIINRGAALLALIDKIQSTPGIIVELTLCAIFSTTRVTGINDRGGCNSHVMFPVGTSPLPMQEVGFMLAHPSMLRRVIFSALERQGTYSPRGGLCGIVDMPLEDQRKYTLYLGSEPTYNGLQDCNTVEGAVKWIERQMDKMGL